MTRGPGAAAALAVLAVVALAAPWVVSDYTLRVLILALQSAVAVIGLAIAFGWTGLIQLGQAAFVGIGAYASALLALRLGLSFWVAMPLSLLLSAAVAAAIAVPMLRLRGHYLAMATVGFNVTAEIVAKNWVDVTGGYDGLSAIPGVTLAGFALDTDTRFYYLSLAVVAIVAAGATLLRHSPVGRALMAVRDDEIASGTSGVPVVRTKVLAFVISSVLAALSGSLYAHYAHYIAPQDFELSRSITLLVMLIAGGEVSILGAVAGAVVLSFLPEWLRFVGDAYLAVFGVGVLLMLILMPDGVAGRLRRWSRAHAARKAPHG